MGLCNPDKWPLEMAMRGYNPILVRVINHIDCWLLGTSCALKGINLKKNIEGPFFSDIIVASRTIDYCSRRLEDIKGKR